MFHACSAGVEAAGCWPYETPTELGWPTRTKEGEPSGRKSGVVGDPLEGSASKIAGMAKGLAGTVTTGTVTRSYGPRQVRDETQIMMHSLVMGVAGKWAARKWTTPDVVDDDWACVDRRSNTGPSELAVPHPLRC